MIFIMVWAAGVVLSGLLVLILNMIKYDETGEWGFSHKHSAICLLWPMAIVVSIYTGVVLLLRDTVFSADKSE